MLLTKLAIVLWKNKQTLIFFSIELGFKEKRGVASHLWPKATLGMELVQHLSSKKQFIKENQGLTSKSKTRLISHKKTKVKVLLCTKTNLVVRGLC